MKKLVILMAAATGAFILTACQSTDNSPAPAAATSCTLNAYGQSVDSLGNACVGTTGTCAGQGLTYNPTTGQWINPTTGVPVACSTGGVTGGIGGSGYGLGGCQYWSTVYPGTQYIPMVDPTTGNLVCINVSSYGVNLPQSYNPYTTPVYSSSCPYNQYNDPNWYADCYGGWGYSGNTYGYSPYSGSGSGVCMGVGGGDGSDYGYGDSFFGICL